MAPPLQSGSPLYTKLSQGKTAFGLCQQLPGANISRTLTRAGADYIFIDCEHGNIDDAAMHEIVPAVAAAGASPLVRIPSTQGWMISRALDAGAHGLIIPLIRSAEQVEAVISQAKFPPLGQRGFGAPWPVERFAPGDGSAPLSIFDYLTQANDTLVTVVQIETKEALDDVERIAAVPGVDVLLIGRGDLGVSLGCPAMPGAPVPPELEAAVERIFKATKAAGKKVGCFAPDGPGARKLAAEGWDFVCVSSDLYMLTGVAGTAMAQAKAP